jgi:phage tail protein X
MFSFLTKSVAVLAALQSGLSMATPVMSRPTDIEVPDHNATETDVEFAKRANGAINMVYFAQW